MIHLPWGLVRRDHLLRWQSKCLIRLRSESHKHIRRAFVESYIHRGAAYKEAWATEEERNCSRLATAKVAWVQAAITNRVLLAQPSKEAFETETVAAVGGGTVPGLLLADGVLHEERKGNSVRAR
jgi:hypothetical protein